MPPRDMIFVYEDHIALAKRTYRIARYIALRSNISRATTGRPYGCVERGADRWRVKDAARYGCVVRGTDRRRAVSSRPTGAVENIEIICDSRYRRHSPFTIRYSP